jgi:hypothetical protein
VGSRDTRLAALDARFEGGWQATGVGINDGSQIAISEQHEGDFGFVSTRPRAVLDTAGSLVDIGILRCPICIAPDDATGKRLLVA